MIQKNVYMVFFIILSIVLVVISCETGDEIQGNITNASEIWGTWFVMDNPNWDRISFAPSGLYAQWYSRERINNIHEEGTYAVVIEGSVTMCDKEGVPFATIPYAISSDGKRLEGSTDEGKFSATLSARLVIDDTDLCGVWDATGVSAHWDRVLFSLTGDYYEFDSSSNSIHEKGAWGSSNGFLYLMYKDSTHNTMTDLRTPYALSIDTLSVTVNTSAYNWSKICSFGTDHSLFATWDATGASPNWDRMSIDQIGYLEWKEADKYLYEIGFVGTSDNNTKLHFYGYDEKNDEITAMSTDPPTYECDGDNLKVYDGVTLSYNWPKLSPLQITDSRIVGIWDATDNDNPAGWNRMTINAAGFAVEWHTDRPGAAYEIGAVGADGSNFHYISAYDTELIYVYATYSISDSILTVTVSGGPTYTWIKLE